MRMLIYVAALFPFLWMPHWLVQVGTPDGGPATSQAAAQAGYPGTAKGLQDLLNDMRAAAEDGDSAQLRILIASTEIPDYRNWFLNTFGAANGAKWAIAYGSSRRRRETELQNDMMQFAQRPGYFSANEIVPTDMYGTLQTPVDLFLANWSPPDVDGLRRRRVPIGYFVYIHGKFCWNTAVPLH
jgi:hypothetical protein